MLLTAATEAAVRLASEPSQVENVRHTTGQSLGGFMSVIKLVALAALCSVSVMAMAQQGESTKSTHDELSPSDFVKKASASGLAEVQLGKLGSQKASDAEVKAFAQQMVTDHTKANEELTQLAKAKGLKPADSPGMMNKMMDEKFDQQKAGKDFDRDFMQRMVKDHKEAVKLFESASTGTALDKDLQAFAKKTLPTLQKHLSHARTLEEKLGK